MRSTATALLCVFLGTTVLGAHDVPLSSARFAPAQEFDPILVAGDDALLLVDAWGSTLAYQRIAADGRLLDARLRFFTMPEPTPVSPEGTWNGSNWVISWGTGTATYAVAIDRDGNASPELAVISYPYGAHPISVDGESVFVFHNPFRIEIYRIERQRVARVDTSFPRPSAVARFAWGWSPLRATDDGRFFFERPTGEPSLLAVPDIFTRHFVPHSAGGGIFWWTGVEGAKFHFALVSRDGTWSERVGVGSPLEPGVVQMLAHASGWLFGYGDQRIDVSLNGGIVRSEWKEVEGVFPTLLPLARIGDHEIHRAGTGDRSARFTFVDAAGRVRVVTAGSVLTAQGTPRIAEGPGLALVVWTENSVSGTEMRATRVLPDGRPLDGEGILLDSRAIGFPPEVVFDGATFVVVWQRPDFRILATRVSLTGIVLDDPPLQISEARGMRPQLATLGDGRSLLYWQSEAGDVARTLTLGALSDVTIGLPRAATIRNNPELAGSGDRYLLVWDRLWTPFPTFRTIGDSRAEAQILDAGGHPLTAPFELPGSLSADSPIAIAADDGWIVSWSDFGRRPGVRVSREGAVEAAGDLIPDPLAMAARDGTITEVTADGVLTLGSDLRPRTWHGYAGPPATWAFGDDPLPRVRAAWSDGSLLLVEKREPTPRLYLHRASFARPETDVALVEVSSSRDGTRATATLTLENRGPAEAPWYTVVSGFGVRTGSVNARPGPGAPHVTTGASLVAGEGRSIEASFDPRVRATVWVLPAAFDPDAANNHVRVDIPRRRAAQRH